MHADGFRENRPKASGHLLGMFSRVAWQAQVSKPDNSQIHDVWGRESF